MPGRTGTGVSGTRNRRRRPGSTRRGSPPGRHRANDGTEGFTTSFCSTLELGRTSPRADGGAGLKGPLPPTGTRASSPRASQGPLSGKASVVAQSTSTNTAASQLHNWNSKNDSRTRSGRPGPAWYREPPQHGGRRKEGRARSKGETRSPPAKPPPPAIPRTASPGAWAYAIRHSRAHKPACSQFHCCIPRPAYGTRSFR